MNPDGGELDPRLAQIASELSGLAVDPSAEASRRIMAAVHDARVSPVAAPALTSVPFWRRNRPLRLSGIAFALCLTLVGSAMGAMAASADALPGSPNHGLRLARESLSLALAPAREKARLHERFVRERLTQAADAKRRGNRAVASELMSESRQYLQDFNGEIGQLPGSERAAVEGQLHQLEVDAQGADKQGPDGAPPSPGSPPEATPEGGPGGPSQPAGRGSRPDGVTADQSTTGDGTDTDPTLSASRPGGQP